MTKAATGLTRRAQIGLLRRGTGYALSLLLPIALGQLPPSSVGLLAQTAQPGSVLLPLVLPEGPAKGAQLFAQKSCVRCHSLVDSETRLGPDLRRITFAGNVLELAAAFWNHAPIMREKMQHLKIEPPTLTSSEMAEIVALVTLYRHVMNSGSGNAAAGRAIFVAKGCVGCHEREGSSETLGPSLARYRGGYSPIFVAQAMWNHAPTMAFLPNESGAPWPKFAGSEMVDVVAYLQTGNGSSGERVYFEPGSPRRGRELFEAKRCVACHAVAGMGGTGGPELVIGARGFRQSVAEIAGLMWNHSQGMTAAFMRRHIPHATFSGQEMADIIAYLHFANYTNVWGVPTRGALLFTKKCSACHSVGEGRKVGPDLAVVPNLDDPMALIAAMWNHAPNMERELLKRGLAWPRFEPGEPADLAAFILVRRTAAPRSSASLAR